MKQNLINRRNLLRVAMAGTAAAMPSLKEFDETAGVVNQLPVQEVDDQSLIYPAGTKRKGNSLWDLWALPVSERNSYLV